ncbi:MAG: tagatose 1,6-diphosphate aldolase [Bryobacteraceae bacterium]
MSLLTLSRGKRERLDSLSTPAGVIEALAMDQRKSLRRMISEAAGADLIHITDERLAEFKSAVTEVLSEESSAILLDPEYGIDASKRRSAHCGLLLAYEMDGYENPRPNRMLALMPDQSVRRLRDLGAEGIKILLHYSPDDPPAANDEKCALIERIGNECDALDLPFFLEPVSYDPDGLEPRSLDFAKQKPRWVVDMITEFSKDIYKVDVLKVEFPVVASYVEGSAVYCGEKAYSLDEALEWFRVADAAARRPYIFLSAGVSSPEFLESLRLALQADTRFSGVLCGRANWQEGVRAYARSATQFDMKALLEWLRTTGLENVRDINKLLAHATSWRTWFRNVDA